jgi:hypothetical protein
MRILLILLVALALAIASAAWSQGTGDLGAPNTPGTHSPSGGGSVRQGIATRVDPAGSSGDIQLQGKARRISP